MKTKDLRTSKIWIYEDQIIWQEYKLIKELTMEDAKEISETVNIFAEETIGEKKLILSSLSNLLSMTPDVRSYFANFPSKYEWKIALVYDSFMTQIISSLLLKLVTSRFETSSFSNTEKAISWLREEG